MSDQNIPRSPSRPSFMRTSSLTLPVRVQTVTTIKSSRYEPGRFHEYRGFLLLAMFALVLWMNLSFLKPLVMGAIFACVLYPLMHKFKNKKLSETIRAAIITIAFTFVILIPIGFLIVAGASSGLEQIQALEGIDLAGRSMSPSALIDTLKLRWLVDKIAEVSPITESQVLQYAGRGLGMLGGLIGRGLQAFVASLPGIFFANIVIVFTIFFLLLDGRRAAGFFRDNSIFGVKQTDKILAAAQQLCYSVLVATIVSGAVQALLIGIACILTGTEGALFIVLISFIASFFPVVGTAPVTLFLAGQAFFQGDTTSGIIFLVALPIVGTSDNIVRPYVLKGGAELHPLIGFVAAFGGLEAIGFYGLFIGPVVAGLFFTLLPMVTRSYPKIPKAVG